MSGMACRGHPATAIAAEGRHPATAQATAIAAEGKHVFRIEVAAPTPPRDPLVARVETYMRELVRRLSGQPNAGEAAFKAIVDEGSRAIAAVAAFVGNELGSDVTDAAEALFVALGRADPGTIISLVHGGSPKVRRTALRALCRMEHPAARDLALGFAGSPSAADREIGAEVLGSFATDEAVRQVLTRLASHDPSRIVRDTASDALQ